MTKESYNRASNLYELKRELKISVNKIKAGVDYISTENLSTEARDEVVAIILNDSSKQLSLINNELAKL